MSLDATPIVDERIVHDKRTPPPELHGAVVEVFLVRQVETAGAAVAAGALVVACFAAACFMAACFAMAAWVTADLVAHSPVALNSNNRCVHVIEELPNECHGSPRGSSTPGIAQRCTQSLPRSRSAC